MTILTIPIVISALRWFVFFKNSVKCACIGVLVAALSIKRSEYAAITSPFLFLAIVQ